MKIIKFTKNYKFEDLSPELQKPVALIKLCPNQYFLSSNIKGIGMRDGEFYMISDNLSDDMYLSYLSSNYQIENENKITLNEAAKELGVTSRTIRNWNNEGKINFHYKEDSGALFIDKKEIDKKIKENEISAEGKLELLKEKKRTAFTADVLGSHSDGWSMGLENAGFLVSNNNAGFQDVDSTSAHNPDVICSSSRDHVLFSILDDIKVTLPKIFCFETLTINRKKTLEGYDDLKKDYQISKTILRAEIYDVPQRRHKNFVLGVRKDLKISDWPPSPNNYIIPLKTALQNVPESDGESYPIEKEKILKKVKPGDNWKTLSLEDQILYMGNLHPTMTKRATTGGMSSVARRLSWNDLCPLLPSQINSILIDRCHPEETRPLSIAEYARLQSFPDDYDGYLSNTKKKSYRNIVSTIPMNLAFHIGKSFIKILENNNGNR